MEASEFKARFLPLSRRMYWAAWRLTENREESEDLVQDVFLRLWTQRDELPEIENAEAYCVKLIQHGFIIIGQRVDKHFGIRRDDNRVFAHYTLLSLRCR